MKKIPKDLQRVLWSVPLERLNLSEHRAYIVHQVLMFGDFNQIKWLFETYSKEQVVDTFLNNPQKVYTKEALNFVSKYILNLQGKSLQVDKYVNAIS